jgi:hypothetical protein
VKKALNRTNFKNRAIPAIIAVGSSLAALPVGALELGELTVQSRLGQPLRASIAYALAPNEQLSNYCITMRPGPSVSGLPGFGPATVSVANGVIMLTGNTPVREPMVSAHVVVNCPYSANLSREYMLFIDPLSPAYEQATVTQQADPVAAPVVVAAAALQRPVAKDIAPAEVYLVQAGDTLSDIASRIQNRTVGLWPAVNAIFAANPDAFLNNDPNRLIAGSKLSIPSFNGEAAVVATVDTTAEPVNEVAAAAILDSVAYESAAVVEVPIAESAAVEEAAVAEEAVADMTRDLQPGDIILDTELEGPTTTAASPNVPTAVITTTSTRTNGAASPAWLFWLGGGGIALIFGLLMFGRRLRGPSDSTPAESPLAEQTNGRRFSDAQTTDTENVESLGVVFDLSDDSPTEENLALDADLLIGTGLQQGTTPGANEDFGFAATSKLDIELPFEPIEQISDETDMLPPMRIDEQSILESEVLPEADDYDMSVIIDATKMPQPEDVPERDLKAVKVVPEDDTSIAQNYTISKEVDYQVLEQDYEDEMTATQVLNAEIARAAIDLAVSLEKDGDESTDDNVTAALPLASVTELDITAQMPAQNDAVSDLDETGRIEEITAKTRPEDETVEMPIETGKTGS